MMSDHARGSATYKVLLIDPSSFSGQFYTRLLEPLPDIVCRCATSTEEGIRLAEQLLPTVVVHAMPAEGVSRLAFIDALRQNPSTRDIPLLVLSAFDDPQMEAQALAAGADDYFQRGAGQERFVEKLRANAQRYLRSVRAQPAAAAARDRGDPRARVLMIDDSKMVCLSYARKLDGVAGTTFTACSDPAEGLELAKRFAPTVILLDLEMPRVSGFEVLSQLRADPITQEIPVIVLSAITDPEVKARAFTLGANDYAEKQMHTVELESRIAYHSRAFRNAVRLDESIREMLEANKRIELQRNFIRRTFGRYLSDDVVANILETPEGLQLGGAKREVSLVMADLRGFTALSERLPPESVLAIVNNYLRVMTDILMHYHGTIDEFMGDAILAMFGAPSQREDDAPRAVACALAMQLAMAQVNGWNRKQGYPEVAMGIGINTGEVVVGNIGSERRSKYGVVGRNVNLTARVEACTVGGQILVTQGTLDACGGILRVDGRLEVMPKGVHRPLALYDVGGIGGAYRLYLPERREVELARLARPLRVSFSVLEDKRAVEKSDAGLLVRLGPGCAELETETALAQLTDLKLTLAGPDGETITDELYGKVVRSAEARGGALRLVWTSVPPPAAAFLSAQPTVPGAGAWAEA